MIVNKYNFLFLNNETKQLASDTVNASHMKEAIERCEAKHSFKINVLSCTESIITEQPVPLLVSPVKLGILINMWNDQSNRAHMITQQIHRHVDMLIKHDYFINKEESLPLTEGTNN